MSNVNINVALGNRPDNQPIFRDVTFKLRSDNGDVDSAKDLDAIRQGIHNLFTWATGSRILEPEFPGGLYKFRYEQINSITESNIRIEINNMFKKYEPRVRIEQLDIIGDPKLNQYTINIRYSIPTLTNRLFNYGAILQLGE